MHADEPYDLIMDPKNFLGIAEIDAQHEELDRLITALQKALPQADQLHLVHPTIKRLHQLLTTHFDYEESLMAMVNHPELAQHKKMHKGVLKLFSDYLEQPHATSLCGDDHPAKLLSDKVLSHVMEHDVQMTSLIKDYLKNLRSPA